MLRVLGLTSIIDHFEDSLEGTATLVVDIKPFVTQTVCYYHCRSAMICRDDLELRWRLLMCENEFSHISLLLYISTAF